MSNSLSEFFDEKLCLNEFQDESCSKQELKNIISSITWESPLSDSLFKGKYLIFIVSNLLSWQKPLGEYFHSHFAICAVKPKKTSESENTVFDKSLEDTVVDESSYIGNPLLVQFEKIFQHNSDSQTRFLLRQLNSMYNLYPLPESIGRKLLFMCKTVENSLKLPFVALCHGNNPKQAVLLGNFEQENVGLKVMNLGSVFSLKKLPKMHDLKEAHLANFNSQNCVKSNVAAHYDFLEYKIDKPSLVPVKGAKLSIDCSWSEPLSLLELFTPECICTAKMNTVFGDEETGAFNKFKELKFLKTLQQNSADGVMTWSNTNSTSFVMENINNLINEEGISSVHHKEFQEPKLDLEHIEGIILEERDPLHFTDKLWLVLKNCCSFDEIAQALTHTYESLIKGLNFQPCIHRKDTSTIAKDIMNMSDKPIVCPNITPQIAGKLLLEIGIEKLRKDYKQFFVGLELVPQDLFNNFVHHELLSFDSIIGLEKLHTVLELAIICVKQLLLPKKILSEFVRNTLRHYTLVNEVDLQHVFRIHVPTIYARPLLTLMRPTMWELSLLSSDKNGLKQTIHRFVTTVPEAHIYAPQNYNPKLRLEGSSYVYLHGVLARENACFFK